MNYSDRIILYGGGERGHGEQAGLLFCAITLEKSSQAKSDGRPTDTKFKPCLQVHPCISEIQEKTVSQIFPALEITHTLHVHLLQEVPYNV